MVARQYGVLRDEGYSERAIFIIDKEGIIRYIDIHDIDDQPNNDEVFAILRQIDPENAKKHPVDLESLAAELPHGGIVMYCNTWCPGCRKARAFFEANHLEYKEVDISRNRAAAAQVRRWANGYETTPTFDIDDQILVDYDEKRLREILGDRISA
jgi:peroxiredoxin